MNNKKSISLIIIFTIICGVIYILKDNKENMVEVTKPIVSEINNLSQKEINNTIETNDIVLESELKEYKVYICGAVNKPDVITIKQGSRIIDAIDMVGGMTEEADISKINLASFVEDAQKIYIPKIGEEVDKIDFTGQNSIIDNNTVYDENKNYKIININTANKLELQTLPGIGETISQYILDYRKEKGYFKNIDDIKNVTKIGEKTFEKLKDLIKVTD